MTPSLRRLRLDPDWESGPVEGKLGRSAALIGVGLAAQGGIRLLFNILTARALGPAGYAEYATAVGLGMVGSILLPTSAGAAVSKFTSRAWGRSDGASAAASYAHTRKSLVAYLVGALPVGLALAWLLFHNVNLAVGTAALIAGLSMQAFIRGAHMALGRQSREALVQPALGAVSLGCLLLVLSSSGSVDPGTAALLLGTPLIVYGLAALPKTPGSTMPLPANARREIEGFIFLAAAGSVASAGFVQFVILAGNFRLPAHDAGVLAAAVSIATPLTLASSALMLVLYPRLSRHVGGGEHTEISRLRHRVFALTSLGSAAISITTGLVADLACRIFLGSEFRDASAPLIVLVAAIQVLTLAVGSTAVLTTQGNRQSLRMSTYAWFGLITGVAFWLAWGRSPEAIAWGFAIGVWVTGSLGVLQADRFYGDRLFPAWLAVSAGLAIVTFMGADAEFTTGGRFAVYAIVVWLIVLTFAGGRELLRSASLGSADKAG